MSRARVIALVAVLAAPVTAGADAGAYLYLQPRSPEAARLTLSLASVSAVALDGSEYPLTLNLRTVGPEEARRQRLLASGPLPAGRYTGFLVKVSRATLKSERDETPLVVPEGPVRVETQFILTDQETPVFWLALSDRDLPAGGSEFSPGFSATTPTRPIAEHMGFVTNAAAGTVTIFDKRLAQAIAVLDTCAGPVGMAVDRRRLRLYVACAKDDEVQAIDVASGEIVQRTRVSPGDQPRELALTPDGNTLLTVNRGSASVGIFDAASLTLEDRISVGGGPGSIAVDPSGRRAFVFNALSGSASVLDLAGRRLAATVSLDAAPLRGEFNDRGDRLYVIHDRSPYLTILDPQQLTTIDRVRLGSAVEAIAVDPVRGLICMAGRDRPEVEFYDPHALLPLYFMKTRAGVSHLLIDVEASRLYMVNPTTRTLVVARLADRKVVAEMDVGDGAAWVAIMGER